MAVLGKVWPLIEGSGTIYGMFVIESLIQTKTEFFESGMPRRIEFTLTLKRDDCAAASRGGDLPGAGLARSAAAPERGIYRG